MGHCQLGASAYWASPGWGIQCPRVHFSVLVGGAHFSVSSRKPCQPAGARYPCSAITLQVQ